MNQIRVSSIETMGLLDGPGIRTVIFMQGCPLRCKFCHNPETWALSKGKSYSHEEIIEILKKFKTYYRHSGGGVTFSGGEPLLQLNDLVPLLKLCKENGIHTCVDTSGYLTNLNEDLFNYTDIFLLSIKGVTDEEYINISGVDIKKTDIFIRRLKRRTNDIWIRMVIMPNVNDNKEYMDKLYEFIKDIPNVKKIELLPYSSLAKRKYKELEKDYVLESMQNMDPMRCKKLNQYINDKFFGK